MHIDLSQPFRGADAVEAGLATPKSLRGPRFRRLFTGVYVTADATVDLALRSRAAHLLGPGVLGGWSAAELLDASCGAQDAPAEVVVPGSGRRSRPGLLVRHDRLLPAEVTTVDGVRVTTALRTAFDLARRPPLIEALVAVDALSHAGEFDPAALLPFARERLGARGSEQLAEVVGRANRLAESPMETRIRFAIEEDGLAVPVLQHPVGPYSLDLAYPEFMLAVEYDGREHLTQERAMRDLRREAYITRAGWDVLRFSAYEVLCRPRWVAAQVRRALAAHARGCALADLDQR